MISTRLGLAAAVTAMACAAPTLRVCCGCTPERAAAGDFTHNSLSDAVLEVRAARAAGSGFAAKGALGGLAADARVYVQIAGECRETLALTEEDVHITFQPVPGARRVAVSGGVPVYASALSPVTDPRILPQIQPAAQPFVQQMSLAGLNVGEQSCHPYMGGEASILPGNLVGNGMELFVYGNPFTPNATSPLVLARYPNVFATPHMWMPSSDANGYTFTSSLDAAVYARAPLWSQQLAEDPGSVYAHYVNNLGWADHINPLISVVQAGNITGMTTRQRGPGVTSAAPNCGPQDVGYDYNGYDLPNSPILTGSFAACCAACTNRSDCNFFSFCSAPGSCGSAGNPVDCYMKSSNQGRQPNSDRISGRSGRGPQPALNVTLGPCPSRYAEPGYDAITNGGGAYVYNLLAELDMPGEYYINRTSQMLYVWLPNSTDAIWTTSPWGTAVVAPERPQPAIASARVDEFDDTVIGYLSVNATLLNINGSSNLAFEDVVFEYAQDAAIIINYGVNITFNGVLIQNAGNMALNVTNGSAVQLVSSLVRHAGNGAVYLYAGDRFSLTPSQHIVQNSSLSYSNRYMFCYVPMVALGHCGNSLVDSEVFGGPHQGIFIEGNNHLVRDSLLHDLVQGASDSGAIYMGRDFTYQGNHILNNVFERIASTDGPDVSAVYLDDEISGFTIVGNTFINVSRALLLGGGRNHIFANNTINGVTGNDAAVHVDNRGMNWAQNSCSGDGELIQFLNRVPYNTSPAWIAQFPDLLTLLEDEPCVPKYNVITGNKYCNLVPPFLDVTDAQLAGWNSSETNNTPSC